MRSVMSDPIGAGVDTFTKLMGTFDQLENSKQRRELMAQETADRKLKDERENKKAAREDILWDEAQEKKHGKDTLNFVTSAFKKSMDADSAGRQFDISELSDEEAKSVLSLADDQGLSSDPKKLSAIKTIRKTMQSPELMQAMKEKKQVSLDLKTYPQLNEAFHAVYGDNINKGTDRYGNTGARKRVSRALIDFKNGIPTVSFELQVSPPKEGVGVHIPFDGDKNPIYDIPEIKEEPKGRLERGNIDLNSRPVVLNKDGSISTVLTSSFNIDGKEVLLPLVSDDGKIITGKEAIDNYKKTGKHLGIFDNSADATQYAEALHNSKIWDEDKKYYTQDSYTAPMTHGRNGEDAPVIQLPAALLDMQLNSMEKLGGMVDQLRAKYGDTEFSKTVEGLRKTKAENKAAVEAYEQSGGDPRKFTQLIMQKNPEMPIKDTKTLFEVFSKGRPKMESQKGKQMTDREELERVYGKNSSQVKNFDESVDTKKAGANKTIYGPDGQTKEVFIDKGQDYTPPKGWSLKAPDKIEKDKPASLALKAAAIKRVDEIADRDGDLIKNIAKDEVRNSGVDADKAVDQAKVKIKKIIGNTTSAKEARDRLVKAGMDYDAATDYVKRNSKKAK